MNEEESYPMNDTIREIRNVMENLREWNSMTSIGDQRHVALVLTKLEEAELLAQRIVQRPN